MSRPRPRLSWHSLWILLFAWLFSLPALGASLKPDKAEIGVGETVFVKLDADLALMVDWSASPELTILNSNDKGATVKGEKAGKGKVTVKYLGGKKSTMINVSNVAASKDSPEDDKEAVRMEGMARAMGMPDLDVRIARMLYEVNTGKRSPKRFYEGLRDAGAKMTDVIRVRKVLVDHPDQSFTRQIMGPTFSENGTPVEKTLLTWRRDQTKAAIDEVVKQFIDAGRIPANGFELIISHVGKWANQTDNSLTFTGDIDFSFVSNDTALAEAMKEAYLKAIQRRTGLDQVAIDSVCTAHGKAGLEVYIGRHGMAFAEEQMKINEVVDMTTGARTKIDGDGAAMRVGAILTIERGLADAASVETKQPVLNTEPGLSMEMARHFQHDIVDPKIFDLNNAVVKAAKYLDRSYKALDKAGGQPSDARLADFARQLTELANAEPQTKEVRDNMIRRISDYLGSPPQTVWDMGTNKLVLTIDHAAVDRFHQDAGKALKETVRQGSNARTNELDGRLRDLLERQRKGDKVDEDVAKLRQEMVDMVDMVEAEIKAAHGMDIPTEVHTNNAKVRGMLDTLVKRFGAKALSEEELKDKKFVEELLKAQAESPSKSRAEMLKAYIMDRAAKTAELSMKGVEKANQFLDIIDDGLLGSLRGDAEFADFEAEMKNVRQAAADPKGRQEAASRLAVLKGKVANGIKAANQKFNGALQATAAGRQGMKFMAVYGLVDEMRAYRDSYNEQGWGGLATEFFRRRVPLGSSVENAIMGNTYRATWDFITTLVPPLGLPEAAYGLVTSIGTTAQSTYWSEQLSLFVDTLYQGAKFELQAVETHGNAKIGVYRLISVSHPRYGKAIDLTAFAKKRQEQIKELNEQIKTPRYKGGGLDWAAYKESFYGLTSWTDVDKTLQRNLAATDPVLQMLEEMTSHPSVVGSRQEQYLAEKGLVRWEEVKLGFITNLIIQLEERRQADQALGAGQLPDLFAELRKTAAELEIEEAMLRGLDAEVDTSNLKSLVNWLWDTKRAVLGQAPKESETLRAAQVVKKYLDAYKAILAARNELAGALSAAAAKDGATRYLTGELFLSGRADADTKAAETWAKHAAAARVASSEALLAIKKEFLPRAALDVEDDKFLERVYPRELWMKPWKDAGTRSGKTWQLDAAIAHGKARNAILDEYKAWLEKQAPVELTVTLLDALDAKRQIGGASGDLRPTDELGKPGVGKASGNTLVFGVPTGRYRLTVKAAGYGDAEQDLVLGRGLTPTPKLTLSLTPSDKKGDGKLDELIAAALKSRDWKRLADRLDVEKKSPARLQNPAAWQTGIDALNKALETLKDERMQWALGAEAYLGTLDNVDSSTWDKLTRQVEKKREAVEERCYQNTSPSEAYEKRKTRCQNEGRQYETNCLSTWPDRHWQERTAIRVAKQEVTEQVHTLHSAGYFSHRAWFEAVEKMTEKYKLPFPFPKPVVPRLKYSEISCASVDLPGAKPTDGLSLLKVTIAAPEATVPMGKAVSLNAAASGGKAPFRYAWSTGAQGDRASVTPGWAGEWTVTVTATDADGKTGEGRATLRVSPRQVKMSGVQPQVFYGSRATLALPGQEPPPPAADPCAGREYTGRNPFDECLRINADDLKRVSVGSPGGTAAPVLPSDVNQVQALPETSPPAGSGKQRVVWQSEPAIGFAPPTSDNGRTQATYSRMGAVKLWCEIQEMVEGAFHTVGECDQETVNVIAPKFSVSFTPPEGQGRIGQDIRLRIASEPSVADNLIDFLWFDPATANRLELTSNAREIAFKVKDARPVVLKALARVPHHDDSIADIAASYTGLQFQVKAWAEEPGTRPMMWDPVKGGLKPVPKGQYATHERIPLRAELQGGSPPAGVRWNWTVNDGTTISNPISQTPTVSRSGAGSIEAGVEARDAEGALLGSGNVTLSVMEVRDTPPAPANPSVSLSADRTRVERGETVSFSANVTGGKPPYRYAWQGANGQEAHASLATTRAGNQAVSVTVTDSQGKTGTARLDISVVASARDMARDKAGKLAAQAAQQAKAGDFEGAANSLEEAGRHDQETTRPVAEQIRDQAKAAAAAAEKKRDFRTSGRLFEAAKRIDRNDQEAHIGANNAVAYQQNQAAMVAKQQQLAGHIARGDWHLAETSQAELKIIDEGLPGGLTPETRDLIQRYQNGQAAYARQVDAKRKDIAADLQSKRYDNARAKLAALRQTHLIPVDEDWARGIAQAIDQAEAESRGKSGPGAQPGAAGIAGKWRSSEGEVTLTQSGRAVKGGYANDGGEIVGEMNGNVLEGYWIENGSAERCATPKNGRHHWGRIRWTFEGGKFSGTWSYCDKPVASGGGWSGERTGDVPAGYVPPGGASSGSASTATTSTSAGNTTDEEWAVVETTRGMYRLDRAGSELRVARQANNPGGLQHAGLRLNRGLPASGDFSAQVGFADARIDGGLNQIELQATFADGSIFYVVRDRERAGSHIWAPNLQGDAPCGRAGVLRMERRGDTVTGYCDGRAIWSAPRKAALTRLQFVLQNNATNDPISVTFRDWRFNATAGTSAVTPPKTITGADLIAAYPLDGDARDASGNNHHGSAQGARATADRFGRAGGAMLFDGKSFIELPLDINPGVYPRLTFTAWVRADDTSPTRQVMSHDNGGYDRSLGIDTRGGGHGWSAFAGSGGVLGFRSVDKGRWTFVAGVWDQPARKVRLVVDDAVMEKDGELGGSDRKLSLGRNPGYGEHFVGAIDDVRLYGRALDMGEIRALRGGAGSVDAAPGRAPRVLEFAWLGMDEDRVGDWGNGKPNGTRDGHFRLTLDASGRFALASLSVWSANEKGEKSGGQIWHTKNGNNWMLGVFRDGRQLNASHVANMGEFPGRVALDLYANSSGWFNPGQWFLVEVESADGKVARQTLRLGDASTPPTQGGREYTYHDQPGPAAPTPGSEPQSLEEAGRQLKDAVKELKSLFKW